VNIILHVNLIGFFENSNERLSLLVALERQFDGPVLITSTQGGTNIEEIAVDHPDAIIRHPIDIIKGLSREDALAIAEKLQFRDEALEDVCNYFIIIFFNYPIVFLGS
jgi:succinyl-CoA synthetase beta subunit